MLCNNLEGVIRSKLFTTILMLRNVLDWASYETSIKKLKCYGNYVAYLKYTKNTLTLVLKM